jgi:hypothetical protein
MTRTAPEVVESVPVLGLRRIGEAPDETVSRQGPGQLKKDDVSGLVRLNPQRLRRMPLQRMIQLGAKHPIKPGKIPTLVHQSCIPVARDLL